MEGALPDRPATEAAAPSKATLARLSLRARVMAVLVLVHVGMMAIAAWLLLLNAQDAIDEEIRTSLEVTRDLSLAVIGSRLGFDSPENVMDNLQRQLPQTRHVRLMLMNAVGDVIWPTLPADHVERPEETASAPVWFRRLIAPPAQVISIPISVGLTSYGALAITSEPSDEIEEVWADFRDLLLLLLLGLLGLSVLIHLLLGRSLAPIATISAGLEGLEQGRFRTRLPPVPVPDLHQIGERFNALATRLEATTLEKERLGQRIVTLQDDERKAIALELHDEFGPCLFGIRVDAHYIQAAGQRGLADDSINVASRAANIIALVERKQEHIRSMLKRLRPMALGHVPLGQLLEDLVNDFRSRHPVVDWITEIPEEPWTHGETVDLTIFRLVQECLTNAARHARSTKVEVTLSIVDEGDADHRHVRLLVSDDGRGLPKDVRYGQGLTGMMQRVQILGGRFQVGSRVGGGTEVSADILLDWPGGRRES